MPQTLNADYIAWKLLKMALEVEYMMDFYHPGLLVTDLHLRSSTDRQSTDQGSFLAYLEIFSHLMLTTLHGNY